MDLISYRGPGAAGGVSSALGNLWKHQQSSPAGWWFMNKNALQILPSHAQSPKQITMFPETIVAGHYRFCNEFLWPILHDLPQFVDYCEEDYKHYKTFNWLMSDYIDFESTVAKEYFVQDYQLALLPQLLSTNSRRTTVFWHIPWPKQVPEEFVEPIREIALGLLHAHALGFHVDEYADNFMIFVQNNLPEYRNDSRRSITKTNIAQMEPALSGSRSPYVLRSLAAPLSHQTLLRTELLVRPLGIDFSYWTSIANKKKSDSQASSTFAFTDKPFILSVDRADYTKSVLERFLFIDRFFEENPHLIGSFTFVQVCGRTRPGLTAFDQYWHACQALFAATNHRWGRDGWQPVHWIEEPLASPELAVLYRQAAAMLVNPVRDGLNLTALEFVACQGTKPGVLILSPGAGAWDGMGQYALPAPPNEPHVAVDSIKQALKMSLAEKHERIWLMKKWLEANTINRWWEIFSQFHPTPKAEISVDAAADLQSAG